MIYKSQSEAIPGQVYGFGDEVIESKVANAQLEMGKAVFYKPGFQDLAYLPDSLDGTLKFAGVVPYKHISYKGSFGVIPAGEQVEVLRSGEVWVEIATAEASIANTLAYVGNVIATPAQYNFFSFTATARYSTNCYFKTNVMTVTSTDFSAQGTPITKYLAVVELKGLA